MLKKSLGLGTYGVPVKTRSQKLRINSWLY
jgi:hypothetical protein